MKKYASAFVSDKPQASTLPTFARYAEKWFPLYHVPKVKPNTANNTRIILHRHIYPALGRMHLDEITPDEIQAFFNTKMHLCRSTMQKMKIVLHQIFESAIEDGYVQRNPAASSRLTISKRTTNLHGATAHIFRHTFATVAAPFLDIKTLQSIMGHADIETTLDRYTHAQEERIRAAGQLLTGKFTSGEN